MNLIDVHQKLLEIGHNGLSIITYHDGTPIFSNTAFEKLLGSIGSATDEGWTKIPEVEALLAKLEPGDRADLDLTLKVKRRTLSLSLHFVCLPAEANALVLVEVQNNSRIKELESMIDSYASLVERNERSLKRARDKAEKLLLNVMPRTVVEELKEFGVAAPTRYEQASVLMLDFVAFTEMSISQDPTAMVAELNDIFTNFDRIVEQYDCERIKTIGDAYMAVSGVPDPNPDHAVAIAETARLFVRYLQQRNHAHEVQWLARIGIATGPVIGSIVGVQKYVYDVFGPAVNLASRMERRCEPMEIVLCAPMSEALSATYALRNRGRENIKGFGELDLFSLGARASG